MRSGSAISVQDARWLAISAQGLGRPRPRGPVTRRHVRAAVASVGTIQLDAINVLERTQFLVLFSRLGPYDVERLHELSGPGGELFEYWGHAASLLPMRWQPLFRWRMAMAGPWSESDAYRERVHQWHRANAAYVAAILDEVRDRGALTAGQLSDPRRQVGEWWDRRSLGRQALEHLFFEGALAGWRTSSFERIYDLPERVIPADVLATPTPSVPDAHRALLAHAAASLGVATVRDLADYYRIKPKAAAPRVAELVEDGELVQVAVQGWREPGYARPSARIVAPTRDHATLLSPFDSLIWDRARTTRVFAFDYRIEVYVPAPKRIYGYYVLPLLVGDRIVGRFDLKADRRASMLRVNAAHAEADVDPAEVAPLAAAELTAMARWLGLDEVTIERRGTMADALRAVR